MGITSLLLPVAHERPTDLDGDTPSLALEPTKNSLDCTPKHPVGQVVQGGEFVRAHLTWLKRLVFGFAWGRDADMSHDLIERGLIPRLSSSLKSRVLG